MQCELMFLRLTDTYSDDEVKCTICKNILNIQKSGKSAMTHHLKRLKCKKRAEYKFNIQSTNY